MSSINSYVGSTMYCRVYLCVDMKQCKMTVNAVFGSLRENLILKDKLNLFQTCWNK
jgi:hypothetical protein